jgi:hypothetical protein
MTTQLTTPSPPVHSPSGPVRRRNLRAAAATTAALIATGAYLTTTNGPDPAKPGTETSPVGPRDRVTRAQQQRRPIWQPARIGGPGQPEHPDQA